MNQIPDARFSENVLRLALGFEPVDSGLGTLLPHAIRIEFDSDPRGLPRPRIARHNSCRHVLLFDPSFTSQVDLRLVDDRRRIVPRRMRIPLRPLAVADTKPYTDRVRRPVMFPGAAYDLSSLVTGLRGRVLRGGNPMRWARVIAVTPGTNSPAARAHGDDRGEFLLLIGSAAAPVTETDTSVSFDVQIWGPAVVPVPVPPTLAQIDPLWDLPLEKPVSLGNPDPVDPADPMFAGLTTPDNYILLTTVTTEFPLAQVISAEFSI